MNALIKINSKYSSLDKLQNFLSNTSNYKCQKEYDIWDVRTDAKGQMAQCLTLKKNNMNAIKAFFVDDSAVKIDHIIPNKLMHAYFGKSVKARRNIIEILAGTIKQAVLKGTQENAFKELEQLVLKAAQ